MTYALIIALIVSHLTFAYIGLRIGYERAERKKEAGKQRALRTGEDMKATLEGRARPAGL